MQNIKIYEIPTIDYVEKIDDPRVGMIFYIADIDMYYSVKTLKEINSYNTKGDKVVEYIISDYVEFGSGSGGGSSLTAQQLANIAKIPVIQNTVDSLPNNYAAKAHRHDASEIDNLPSGGNGASTTIVDNLNSTSTTSALSANQGRVIKSSLDDMKSNTYNKSEVDRKISEIVVEGGGISFRDVEEGEIFEIAGTSNPAIYGNLIISTTTLTVEENASATFTVKLDKAPTNSQTVNISVNNGNCTVNPKTLTFTNANYNQAQTITVNGVHDSSHYNDKNSTINITSSNVASKSINVTITNIDEMPSEVVNVQSVSLNKDTHAMKVNETVQLTHTITPPNATNKEVTWETNNSNCTVDNGLVTAKHEGECVITCKTVDQNKTAECAITIEAKEVSNNDYVTENLAIMYDLTKYEDGYTGDVIDEVSGIAAIALKGNPDSSEFGFKNGEFNVITNGLYYSWFKIPNHSSFTNYPFSFEFYIKPTKMGSAEHNSVLFSNNYIDDSDGSGTGNGLGFSAYNDLIKLSGPVSQPSLQATYTLSYNEYHHVVCCCDANKQAIYIDGVQIAEGTQKSTDVSTNTKKMMLFPSVAKGSVKLIRIYTSYLTNSEIAINYNSILGGTN